MSVHYHHLREGGTTKTLSLMPSGHDTVCDKPLHYLVNGGWVWLDGREGSPDDGYCTAALDLERDVGHWRLKRGQLGSL